MVEAFGPDPFMGFAHIRFLNHLHTWTIPIMIGAYLKYRGELVFGFKILLIFIISCWWSLVFASDARGTSLGLLISLFLVIILYKKNAVEYLKYFTITALIGLAVYYAGFHLFHDTGGKVILTRTGTTGRLELWAAAFEYIKQYPLSGLGPMHFSNLQNPYMISSPHNMYLLWGAEWGLPALFDLMISGAILLVKWIKVTYNKATNFNISLTASLLAVLVHSNFSGLFISPLSQLMGCLIIGIIIGHYYKYINKDIFLIETPSKPIQKIIGCILLVVSILTFSIFVTQLPDLNDRREKFKEETNTARIYPRFWDQGFIGND
ncbi:MAG: O-antigen ligase family protein [Gracilimonas sp.]|nr:O-antigen ligase family protein [Gracilimonas sp.]